MPFQFSESGGESFVLTANQPQHVDLTKSLTLSTQSTVEVFTSAQFAGVHLWALDAANAQAMNAGMPFNGIDLSPTGQFGLTALNLSPGTWYFGASDTAAIGPGGSVGAFVDASIVSSPGVPLAANIPMAVYGNPGSWRALGFDVSGAPQSFFEAEAVGGRFVFMTDAQLQAFSSTYAHGYNGGDFAFVAPAGGAFLAGDQGAVDLPAGRYDLVWINDTNGWSGGAANLSVFSGGTGPTGNAAMNNLNALVSKDLPTPGNDDLLANPNFAEIHAGAGDDTITGSATSTDYLRGDDGNDSIQGGPLFDDINGNKGNDTIDGGSGGSDWLVGGQGNDLITAHNSDNILYGNLGNDTLIGGSGNDVMRGGQGDDSIVGGSGNDYISGDRGNDTESGGPGADVFHTFSGAGIDKVLDFNQAEGDRVMVDPGTTYTVSQVGSDTVVDMGNGDQMILAGVQMSTLTPGWIFGA